MMDIQQGVGGAPKRLREGEDPVPPAQKPKTDGNVPENLYARLQSADPSQLSYTHILFQSLEEAACSGTLLALPPATAQTAFNELLAGNEIDAFVAAFTQYTDLERKKAAQACEPYTSRLVLKLPEFWSFIASTAMEDALSKLSVDCVVVLPNDDSSLIPAGVSVVLRALLQAGTTELYVGGALADAQTLADAIPGSPLKAIALGNGCSLGPPFVGQAPANPAGQNSYATLMGAMAKCRTLEHFTVNDPCILSLHSLLANFNAENGTALKTVELHRDMELLESATHAPAFMEALSNIETLTQLNVYMDMQRRDMLQSLFFAPFQKSPRLTRLHLFGNWAILRPEPQSARVLLDVIAFATRCATLTHFTWSAEFDGGAKMAHEFLEAIRDAQLTKEERDALVKQLANPNLKLQHLHLASAVLTPESTRAFWRGLEQNVSLRELVFKHLYMEFVFTVHGFQAVLDNNKTIRRLVVPTDSKLLYLQGGDRLRAFAPRLGNDEDDDDSMDEDMQGLDLPSHAPKPRLKLWFSDQDDLAAKVSAQALLARWDANMASFPGQLERRHAQMRRDELTVHAHEPLRRNMESLFDAMLKASNVGGEHPLVLEPVGLRLTEHLSKERALPTAVHANEVSKTSNPAYRMPAEAVTEQQARDLRELVAMDRHAQAQPIAESINAKAVFKHWYAQVDIPDVIWDRVDDLAPMAVDPFQHQELARGNSWPPEAFLPGSADTVTPEPRAQDFDRQGLKAATAYEVAAEFLRRAKSAPPWRAIVAPPALPQAGLSPSQQAAMEIALEAINVRDPIALWQWVAGHPDLLNVVQADGTNVLLLRAAMVCDPALVFMLVIFEAYDFDRRAEAMAGTSETTEAFQLVLRPTTTASTANITTTTTTAAVTHLPAATGAGDQAPWDQSPLDDLDVGDPFDLF